MVGEGDISGSSCPPAEEVDETLYSRQLYALGPRAPFPFMWKRRGRQADVPTLTQTLRTQVTVTVHIKKHTNIHTTYIFVQYNTKPHNTTQQNAQRPPNRYTQTFTLNNHNTAYHNATQHHITTPPPGGLKVGWRVGAAPLPPVTPQNVPSESVTLVKASGGFESAGRKAEGINDPCNACRALEGAVPSADAMRRLHETDVLLVGLSGLGCGHAAAQACLHTHRTIAAHT